MLSYVLTGLCLVVVLPELSARRLPRQNWPSGPPRDVFNNFGPSWGLDQPWGRSTAPPPPPDSDWGVPDSDWGQPDGGDDNSFPPPNEDPDSGSDDSGPPAQTGQTLHLPPAGCNCLSTPQFNPVCGSDGNTYKNSGLLNCFRNCGTNVFQRRLGACG